MSSPKGKTEVKNYNAVKGSFDVIVKNIFKIRGSVSTGSGMESGRSKGSDLVFSKETE